MHNITFTVVRLYDNITELVCCRIFIRMQVQRHIIRILLLSDYVTTFCLTLQHIVDTISAFTHKTYVINDQVAYSEQFI